MTIRHEIVIYRPPVEVFAHLADDDHVHGWFAVVRLMSGSVVAKPAMTVYEPGRYLAFRDDAARLATYVDFGFTHVPGGTRLEYALNVELVGAWRWLAPYLRLTGPRVVIQRLRQLRDRLEVAPALAHS